MHYKSLCRVMIAIMSLSLVVPSVAVAVEKTEVSSEIYTGEASNGSEAPPAANPGQDETTQETNPPVVDTEPETTPETTPSESETVSTEANTGTSTEQPSESDTPITTEPVTEPTTEPTTDPADTETDPTESDSKKPTEKPTESETESNTTTEQPDTTETVDTNQSQYADNQSLIANQRIIMPMKIINSFRFVTIDKVYALAQANDIIVYSEKSDSSKTTLEVGKLSKNALCFIIKDEDDDWIYIESGKVRGFVKRSDLIIGDEAKAYVKKKKEKKMKLAEALVEPKDNPALTYTKTTTGKTVVKKKYAISNTENLNIRESKSTKARVIGTLPKGALCYILADANEKWVFVESGDVRGFVSKKLLITGKDASKLVKESVEEDIALAKEIIKPEDNKACYYTYTSTKQGTISSTIRDSMVVFAQQFVGNAYVWGGVSLTNGADCSGFVQSIYAQYGYTLPRVAEDQAQFGMKIPVSEAAPGDLIFYAKDGYIHHVVMYIGNGQTVEAQSTATGIVNASVNTGEAVWATRIISDNDAANMALISNQGGQYTSASDADIGQLLGNFKLTAYCACPICCGQWSGGPTASGLMPVEGRTVAMAGVPFGTRLVINGQIYTVDDRGTPYGHVDIYLTNHQEAVNFGVQSANVFLAN